MPAASSATAAKALPAISGHLRRQPLVPARGTASSRRDAIDPESMSRFRRCRSARSSDAC